MVVFKFNKKKLWLVALPIFVLVALALLFIPFNQEADEPLDEPMHVLPEIWEKEELERSRLETGTLGKIVRLDTLA